MQTFTTACKRYNLIEKNDCIVVAMSGGKDSYTLMYLLNEYSIKYNLNLKIVPLSILTGFGDFNNKIKVVGKFCDQLGLKHQTIGSNFSEIITEHNTDKSVCSFCARLRRGKLYEYCRNLQKETNQKVKLALGHHADDCIESFLMAASQKGELFTQVPIFNSDDGQVCIIRPLILTFESKIIEFAQKILGNQNYENSVYKIQTIDCCCPYSGNVNHNRYRMKMLIKDNFTQKGNEKQNLLNTCQQLFSQLHVEGKHKNQMQQSKMRKENKNEEQ